MRLVAVLLLASEATALAGLAARGALRTPAPRRTAQLCAQAGIDDAALVQLGGALVRAQERQPQPRGWQQVGSTWLLLPEQRPWGVVHFVGGAALGEAPQLCYDGLLSAICNGAGVAVFATPYSIARDHDRLARKVGQAFEEACALAEADGICGPFPASGTFRLGHSLGGKLLTILSVDEERVGEGKAAAPPTKKSWAASSAATEPAAEPAAAATPPKPALGLLAYNNFGIADSAKLAAAVLEEMGARKGVASTVGLALDFAQQLGEAQGLPSLEFTPSPAELDAAVSDRFGATSVRLWQFEDDQLDSSNALLSALPPSSASTLTQLRGTHTAPVLLRLKASELDPLLGNLMGGLGVERELTLGDAELVEELSEELIEWLWPPGLARPSRKVLAAASSESVPLEVEVL